MTLIEEGNSIGIVSRNANRSSAGVLKLLELVCSENARQIRYFLFNFYIFPLTILSRV